MKLIILAAGSGTRLKPHTKNIPKCMVKINNLPIIHHQNKIIKKLKIFDNNKYLVGGYKNKNINVDDYKKIINSKYKNTNMLYSLFCAEKLIKDTLIISYGDIIYSENILKKLINSKANISVVVDRKWRLYWKARFKNPLIDAETLKLDKKSYITEIGLKTNTYRDIQGQFIGLIKINQAGSKIFQNHYKNNKSFNGKNYKKAYMTDFLQDLIINGYKIKAVETSSPWVEIDTTDDLKNPITLKRLLKLSNE